MKELTKAEEQVMHPLWQMGNATVKQIIEHLPESGAGLQYRINSCAHFGEERFCGPCSRGKRTHLLSDYFQTGLHQKIHETLYQQLL